MSRAKKHHQAPQAYLRNFAGADGFVQAYDRVTQLLLPRQHVKNVAAESNLYTFEDAAGNASDSFEQGPLARIDGDIARIIPKMLEPTPQLTARDRAIVNVFLAFQFMRTRAIRDFLADRFDSTLRFDVEMNVAGESPERVEQFIEQNYADASEKEKDVIRAIAADPSKPVVLDTADWLKAIVEHLPALTDLVMSRDWRFVRPESGAFLSCDNPVVLVGPQPVGLGNAVFIVWPLSPNRILWRGMPNTFDGSSFEVGSAPPDLVGEVNQLTANQASRQIFWHPATNPVADIVLPSGPQMSSVNGMPVAPGEQAYDKVRADWLRVRDTIRARRSHHGPIAELDEPEQQ